ncbi:MAG: hypothetical protein NTX40_03395 [Planctomycetota bacterium]|nr:hypothetical protein [Planctomycetota bacterium]
MRELSLIAAIVAILAATIVLAQEELKPAAPAPAAAEPAAPPPAAAEPAARANPFSPLDPGAAPPPGSASTPPVETSPAQADAAVSQTASPAAVKLNGILYCESKPLVVINDLIAGIGDEVAGMRVTAIARDKVTLAGFRGVWVMTPLQPEARPAPAVPPAPAEAGKPAVEPEAEASAVALRAMADRSADEEALKAAGGTPVVAAETTDQPIGKENP